MYSGRVNNNCKRSELSGVFNDTDFLYNYMFQAVCRAIMF